MCDLMLGVELWVIGDKAGTDGRLVLVEVPPAENTINTQLITQLHTNVDQQILEMILRRFFKSLSI